LFTLMFTFSGCYHALSKLTDDTRNSFYDEHWFASSGTSFNFEQLQATVKKPLNNISIVSINNQTYWQVNAKKEEQGLGNKKGNKQQEVKGKDLMKAKEVAAPSAIYINTNDYSMLEQGETKYANYLATKFSKHQPNEIQKTLAITKFEDEYGFVNKRLPVFKVSYATNSNERYYVETASGKLSLRVDDKDVVEGYSFALLHKHEFMAWAGKSVKDISTMFWAMAQIVLVVFGFILYFKMRKREKGIASN